MAVLNIESFPDDLHEKLVREAEKAHRSLAQQVIYLLEEAVKEPAGEKLDSLIEKTFGIWTEGDGLRYQQRLRAGREDRTGRVQD